MGNNIGAIVGGVLTLFASSASASCALSKSSVRVWAAEDLGEYRIALVPWLGYKLYLILFYFSNAKA